MESDIRSRKRRRAASVVFAAAAAAAVQPAGLRAADRTFRTSLISAYNPLQSQFGISTNNYYADFGVEGNLVGLGTIVGTGVVFVDISNPAAPAFKSYYNPSLTTGGSFQDVIIRGNIAYGAVDDGSSSNGGIHVLDVSNPAAPQLVDYLTQADGGFTRNHTITLDGNYLYAASNLTAEVKVFNVSNPASPSFVRTVVTGGSIGDNLHDMTVKNGRMYTSNISTGLLQIYDVSNIGATPPTLIGQISGGAIGTRNHSSSVNDEGTLIAIARETSNGNVQLWDISNPAAPVRRASIFNSTPAPDIDAYTPHNPVIVGDTMYVSWYQAGLQIFNIRNPSTPVLVGAYDTFVGGLGAPGGYFTNYDGNWGVNPSLGHDKVLLSDMDSGLFIVDATPALTYTWTLASDTNTWQNLGSWNNGTAPMAPDGTDVIARFTDPVAGSPRTVHINGGTMRVGTIDFSADLSYLLTPAAGTGGRIEMNVTSGAAAINVLNVGSGNQTVGVNRFGADLEISDDLIVTNNSLRTDTSLVLDDLLAMNRTITFKGPGETSLQGANPWTGSLVIDGGRVHGGQSRLGAAATPITIRNGGYLGINSEGSSATVLNPARVLNFDSGIGRVEARGVGLIHTVAANTPDQIRGGGTLNKSGNGLLLIGAANPNFTGSATVSGGILELRHEAAVNQRPITLRAGRLSLRSDSDADFVSDITVAPPEVFNPAAGPSTTIYVDRSATGSGRTLRLGHTTVGGGLKLSILGNNGYGLALDSLSNAGRIDTVVPLTISGPVTLNGPTGLLFSGTIEGSGDVFADGGMTVTSLGRRAGTGLLRVTGTLTIAPGARLDTTTTDLLVDYTGDSPAEALRDLVRQGRDTGIGIVTLGTPSNTVLAIIDNADWRRDVFRGLPIDLSTVIGKYTWYGDANLDGKVTGDDYVSIDSNLGIGDSWLEGDFNLDGRVSGDDYVAIDSNLGAGSTNPLALAELKAEMVALHVEMFGEEYLLKLADFEANGFHAVPEPGFLGLAAIGTALTLRRRR